MPKVIRNIDLFESRHHLLEIVLSPSRLHSCGDRLRRRHGPSLGRVDKHILPADGHGAGPVLGAGKGDGGEAALGRRRKEGFGGEQLVLYLELLEVGANLKEGLGQVGHLPLEA